MFGFGRKKDAAQAEAPAPGQEARPAGSKRRTALLGGLAALVVAGAAAYLYLPPDLFSDTPPPMPPKPMAKAPAAAPKPAPAAAAPAPAAPSAAAAAPAAKPAPVAAAPKLEAKPAPAAAAPALKPEPKAVAAAPELKPTEPKPATASKPKAEPKPKPVVVAEAPKAEPKPEPVAPPKLGLAPVVVPAPISVASTASSLKFNDVMTAVLYRDREAVTQLLDLGRWIDKRDSNGYTPLMAAVHNRDYSMVQLLLERGADPAAQAPGGAVALEMARKAGDGAIESLLLKHAAAR